MAQSLRESLETIAEHMGAGELPTVSASDNGKTLVVAEGQWAKGDFPAELPAVTSADAGKVLTVDSSGKWVAAALPE